MQVTLLGTGCPAVDTNRYGPAALVQSNNARLLIDCGSGVTQRLLAAGCPGKDIDAVLLTHLHTDHIVDLYQLIVSSWHAGRTRPQRVFGPPGTQAYLDGLMALWQTEREARIAYELQPSTAALEVQIEEIAEGKTLRFGDISVDVVAVDHHPVTNAFGFVCAAAGKRIVISGDTTYCPNLISAASGADLLVHEVFIHHEIQALPGVRSKESIQNISDYHTLSSVVGAIATAAKVGCLMLTHFVPPRFDKARLLAEVKQSYSGPVLIGEDFMTFNIADRSVSYGNVMFTLGS